MATLIRDWNNRYGLRCGEYRIKDGRHVKVVTWRNTKGKIVSAVEDLNGTLITEGTLGTSHEKALAKL